MLSRFFLSVFANASSVLFLLDTIISICHPSTIHKVIRVLVLIVVHPVNLTRVRKIAIDNITIDRSSVNGPYHGPYHSWSIDLTSCLPVTD